MLVQKSLILLSILQAALCSEIFYPDALNLSDYLTDLGAPDSIYGRELQGVIDNGYSAYLPVSSSDKISNSGIISANNTGIHRLVIQSPDGGVVRLGSSKESGCSGFDMDCVTSNSVILLDNSNSVEITLLLTDKMQYPMVLSDGIDFQLFDPNENVIPKYSSKISKRSYSYPIRIVYVNDGSKTSSLTAKFTDAGGNSYNNWPAYCIYEIPRAGTFDNMPVVDYTPANSSSNHDLLPQPCYNTSSRTTSQYPWARTDWYSFPYAINSTNLTAFSLMYTNQGGSTISTSTKVRDAAKNTYSGWITYAAYSLPTSNYEGSAYYDFPLLSYNETDVDFSNVTLNTNRPEPLPCLNVNSLSKGYTRMNFAATDWYNYPVGFTVNDTIWFATKGYRYGTLLASSKEILDWWVSGLAARWTYPALVFKVVGGMTFQFGKGAVCGDPRYPDAINNNIFQSNSDGFMRVTFYVNKGYSYPIRVVYVNNNSSKTSCRVRVTDAAFNVYSSWPIFAVYKLPTCGSTVDYPDYNYDNSLAERPLDNVTPGACTFGTSLKSNYTYAHYGRFDWYSYPDGAGVGPDSNNMLEFAKTGFANGEYRGSSHERKITWSQSVLDSKPTLLAGYRYQPSMDLSHFGFVMTTFFSVWYTGVYTFQFDNINQAATFQFGRGAICGDPMKLAAINNNIHVSRNGFLRVSVFVNKGNNYPVRMVYVNNGVPKTTTSLRSKVTDADCAFIDDLPIITTIGPVESPTTFTTDGPFTLSSTPTDGPHEVVVIPTRTANPCPVVNITNPGFAYHAYNVNSSDFNIPDSTLLDLSQFGKPFKSGDHLLSMDDVYAVTNTSTTSYVAIELYGFFIPDLYGPYTFAIETDLFASLQNPSEEFGLLGKPYASGTGMKDMDHLRKIAALGSTSLVAVDMYGFFVPSLSGHHTFTQISDYYSSLQLGAGPQCNGDFRTEAISSQLYIVSERLSKRSSGTSSGSDSSSANMYYGYSYPIRYVAVFKPKDSTTDLEITDPNGTPLNFENIYQMSYDQTSSSGTLPTISEPGTDSIWKTITSTGPYLLGSSSASGPHVVVVAPTSLDSSSSYSSSSSDKLPTIYEPGT
ncbi:hypothetical protein FF38_07469, partial [Lucilia cuprina]